MIFSIDCSISDKMLTTTSDDRSVKIWNLHFADNHSTNWASCNITASKSMFGHTARVFQHKIIKYADKAFIVTVGEDSNVCIWTADGRLVSREFVADGVSLYNLAYDGSRHLLLICGNDGNIHQLPIKTILDARKFEQRQLELSDLGENEYPAKLVTMQRHSILIVLTNRQNLFYKRLSSAADDEWTAIEIPSNRYKITVIEAYDELFAIGGYHFATIFRYENGHFDIALNEKLSAGVIRAFKFIDRNEFAICDGRGNGAFYVTDTHTAAIEKVRRFELPVCKEQWFTACGRYGDHFVVSDRNGHLLLYEIDAELDEMTLKHTLRHVNGLLGCTTFRPVKSDALQLQTIGHDGTMKTINIDDEASQMRVQWRRTIPMAWCDKIHALAHNGRWLLAGFNDSHFIMWQDDGEFRFEFDCGGGHRYWDIYIDETAMQAHLIFIRHKVAQHITFGLNDSRLQAFDIAKSNWHTRACNVMRTTHLWGKRYLLISGGENNFLKFSVLDAGGVVGGKRYLVDYIGDMVSHISSIRAIQTVRLPSNRLLVFSAGGRSQICVTEVEWTEEDSASDADLDNLKIHGKSYHSKCFEFREICDFMLRSSDMQRKRSGLSQDISFDPETRFMDLVAYAAKMDEIRIVVACSDGFIRSFCYANGSISLCSNSCRFYGRCILNVHHMRVDDRDILLTMATDGIVQFWHLDKFTEQSKPIFSLKHHDSGINSFDVLRHDGNQVYIATGGDDQAIVLSLLEIESTTAEAGILSVNVLQTKRFPYNHTAQVNGVRFCRQSMALYSISVDQTILRIVLADFSIEAAGYSCISDVKGLQIISDESTLIAYGCGLQILDS